MPQIDLPLDKLQSYTGSSPVPADFDAYWQRALEELNAHAGSDVQWSDAAFQIPGLRCRDLSFVGVGGARIHARCVFPHSGRGKTPALLKFHGYTMNAGDWTALVPFAAAGMAVAALDVRGQGGESTDPGGTPGVTQRGHIIRGIEASVDQLFYRNVFLDTVQLARLMAGLPEIDENRLGAFGASQGGALAIACAALEPRIGYTVSVYPFLSDYRRVWDLEAGNSAYEEIRYYLKRRDPRHEGIDEFFERLGYIDIQNLAPRITSDVLMFTGLMDPVCPPSTQFAVYNKLAGTREMLIYPDFGHEPLPDQPDISLRRFMERFGLTG